MKRTTIFVDVELIHRIREMSKGRKQELGRSYKRSDAQVH